MPTSAEVEEGRWARSTSIRGMPPPFVIKRGSFTIPLVATKA